MDLYANRSYIYYEELPFQIIPQEYQGWFFLIFVIISFILLLVGFYLIAIEYGIPKKAERIPDKKGGKK